MNPIDVSVWVAWFGPAFALGGTFGAVVEVVLLEVDVLVDDELLVDDVVLVDEDVLVEEELLVGDVVAVG